jgi:hypothetical protein
MYLDVPPYSHQECIIADRKVPDYAAHLVVTSIATHEAFLKEACSVIEQEKSFLTSAFLSAPSPAIVTVLCLRIPSIEGNPEKDKLALSAANFTIGVDSTVLSGHAKFLVSLAPNATDRFCIGNVAALRGTCYFVIESSEEGRRFRGLTPFSPFRIL